MTTEHVNSQAGPFVRGFDRVKRPIFFGFFIMSMVGAALVNPFVFAAGTAGFSLVGLLHVLVRRAATPLLGNYLGIGRYLRITTDGRILLSLAVVVGLASINARINLLILVLGMLLAVVIMSGMLSETTLRRLSFNVFLPSTAFANEAFPARLTVRNGKKKMPSYSIHLEVYFDGPGGTLVSRGYLLKAPPNGAVTLEHLINIDSRGRYLVRRIRVATRFPFGIFEKWSYLPVEAEVLMFPALGRLTRRIVPSGDQYRHPGTAKVLNQVGHDEFWGIREYRDGDNPQHIHWRSSARLGKRFVKEFHREEAQNVCILLDACIPEDSPPSPGQSPVLRERFEHAVSFAATLSQDLLGQDYGVAFAAHGRERVRLSTDRGARQGRQVLTALAEIQPGPDVSFESMAADLDPRFSADATIVAVLLDSSREPAARALLQRAWNHRLRIISVDSPAFAALFIPPAEGKA